MTKKGTTEVYVQESRKAGKDRNLTMKAKPFLPLYPEYILYIFKIGHIKNAHNCESKHETIFTSSKSSGILDQVRSMWEKQRD